MMPWFEFSIMLNLIYLWDILDSSRILTEYYAEYYENSLESQDRFMCSTHDLVLIYIYICVYEGIDSERGK